MMARDSSTELHDTGVYEEIGEAATCGPTRGAPNGSCVPERLIFGYLRFPLQRRRPRDPARDDRLSSVHV